MRSQLFACCFLMALAACHHTDQNTRVLSAQQNLLVPDLPLASNKILGTYSGEFRGSPIALTLRYLSAGRVSGYNIHKGLKRNVMGNISLEKNLLHLQLNEPGTNPYDGAFDLKLDTITWKADVVWTPLKKGETVAFKLEKQKEPGDQGSLYTIFIDSLQNTFELKPDGSCVYNVLTNDSLATAQQISLRGNYKLEKDSTLRVFWQKNNFFPSGKSSFRLSRVNMGEENSDYYLYMLSGEGRTFNQLID